MRLGSSNFRDGNPNRVVLQRQKNLLVSFFHFHIFNYFHIMQCTYCQFIHKFVNFYEKAIIMGELSAGELSVGRIVRGRIVRGRIVL